MAMIEGGDKPIIGKAKSQGGSWPDDHPTMRDDARESVMFGLVQEKPGSGAGMIVFVVVIAITALAVGVYFLKGGLTM